MAGVLELPQLVEDDGMAEMDVRRGGIDAELDAQLPALALGERELLFQGAVGKDLHGAHTQICDETLVGHTRCGPAGLRQGCQGLRRAGQASYHSARPGQGPRHSRPPGCAARRVTG